MHSNFDQTSCEHAVDGQNALRLRVSMAYEILLSILSLRLTTARPLLPGPTLHPHSHVLLPRPRQITPPLPLLTAPHHTLGGAEHRRWHRVVVVPARPAVVPGTRRPKALRPPRRSLKDHSSINQQDYNNIMRLINMILLLSLNLIALVLNFTTSFVPCNNIHSQVK